VPQCSENVRKNPEKNECQTPHVANQEKTNLAISLRKKARREKLKNG